MLAAAMSSSLITYAVKNIAPTLFVHSTEWFLDYSFTDAVSIVSSPVTSYADQIWSIHKSGTSRGFSLDIPLIMLTASILKYVQKNRGAGHAQEADKQDGECSGDAVVVAWKPNANVITVESSTGYPPTSHSPSSCNPYS